MALYSFSYHLALGGNDIKIAFMLPPEFNPNFVPLSYNRLNSIYLPLLKAGSLYLYHYI